jgi:alkyl sulfatase BDS1-like metallo-beta-lactamase superfamily hydrolase
MRRLARLGRMHHQKARRGRSVQTAMHIHQSSVREHRPPSHRHDGPLCTNGAGVLDDDLVIRHLGVRLNGPNAAGKEITLNFVFTDTEENAVLELRNGSLNHSIGRTDSDADATVTLARESLNRVVMGEADLLDEAKNGEITVEPDEKPLTELLSLLDDFDLWFNIIEP